MSLTAYLAIAMLGVGVTLALGVGLAWLFSRLYCTPQRRPPARTPGDYGLPFESVTFLSHGVPLRGWFIPANRYPAGMPTIIVAHGWSFNASSMLPVARVLHHSGFAVLLFDARGHGASGDDDPITIVKFAEDLRAAVAYSCGRADVDATRLGVVGHSLGGAAAIVAASVEPRLRVLVSSSAFADLMELTAEFIRACRLPGGLFLWLVGRFIERWLGTTMADVAPQNCIGHVAGPLLLIHGDADRFIPPANLALLGERARPGQAERWLVPGRGHADVFRHHEYGSRVVEFLDRHLTSNQCRVQPMLSALHGGEA